MYSNFVVIMKDIFLFGNFFIFCLFFFVNFGLRDFFGFYFVGWGMYSICSKVIENERVIYLRILFDFNLL